MDQDTQRWQTLSISRPFRSQWFVVRQDRVRTHRQQELTYTFYEHPGSVMIVPLTDAGEIVLLRQYRYTVNDWCWEVPGGIVDGDDLAAVASRELQEEIGGICRELCSIASFYVSNGMSNEQTTVFLATGVEISQPQLEETELLRGVALPYDEALEMARRGKVTDGPSALALLLCERLILAAQAQH